MELRAARAAVRRRVSAYTTTVTVVGLGLLVVAAAAAAQVAGRDPAPVLLLAVEDTGPGVPPADRERIFERFTQLDSGATRRAGGVGLGLHIARQLANAQDGELVVGDPVLGGPGARFELRLPLTPIAQDPSRTPTR
jgi:signal transduction histidine kinase